MGVIVVILIVLVSLPSVLSSVGDVMRQPRIIESMDRLQVPVPLRPLLPILKLLGVAGLILGIWNKPLGTFTALCLFGYYVGAVRFHRRAKDPMQETFPALVISMLCAVLTLAYLAWWASS
jgi:hypothetical protein